MRMKLFLVVMFLVAQTAKGQDCLAADSILGVTQKVNKPYLKYDKFSDSTLILTVGMSTVPFNGPSAMVNVVTRYSGQVPTDSASTVVTVEIKQMGEGGAIVGKSGGHPLTSSMAKYSDVKDVKFLLDDSVRVSIPIASNTVAVKAAGVFMPEQLIETLTFVLPPDVRHKIVKTHEGQMRLGDYEIKVGHKTIDSLRDATRYLMCSSTVATK